MIKTAYIHFWKKRVGAIAWDSSTGMASFEFEPAFVNQGLSGLLSDVLPYQKFCFYYE